MGECQQDNSLVDIYMGKSFDVLESKSVNFPNEKIKSLSVLKLSKCCRKLLDEAISSYDIGDQEMAYVKYSRYFTIMRIIRDAHHYEKHKEEIYEILGSDEEQMECINRMEALTKSLNQRYKQLVADEKKYNRPIELHNPYILSPKSELEKARKKPKCSCHKLPDLSCRRYITCSEFYKMLEASRSAAPNEIIIDCRPYNDYFVSRIVHPCVINIDEEKIQLGATAAQLASTLSKNHLSVWKIRGNMKIVIILDWNTIEDEPIRDSPLQILMSILTLWDPDLFYPSLKFVKGGYADFVKYYPEQTTNSEVTPPTRICPATDEEHEYPLIAAIPMKEESLNVHVKSVPVTDCETDPNSLKKYNTKIVREMVEKREELADKSISLEKKRHGLEERIQTALVEQENAQDEQTKEKAIGNVYQLVYDIMELENSIHDISEKNLSVSEQINEKQASVPDAVPIEQIKQIEEKEREAQKLKEINEQLAQEKRLSETHKITPVKSPVIDESVSPKMPYNIQQELDPILPDANVVVDRGVIGLKNMGNTCYMNTVFQIVSNTNSLTICFINKVYRKYMAKSKKPGDLVVEHVANLVRTMWSGKYKTLTPKETLVTFSKIYKKFDFKRPHDSFEFLDMLFDTLHSALSVMPPQPCSPKGSPAEQFWMWYVGRHKESIITDLFYGQIKYTHICSLCHHESPEHQPFKWLSLPVPKEQKGDHRQWTLADGLNQYFGGSSQLELSCANCKKRGGIIEKKNIVRLPSVLIIHFVRNMAYRGPNEKRDTYIDFPIKNLQMNEYVAPSELRNIENNHTLNAEYKLYAIANHYGDTDDGHYLACCRNVITNRWYCFNDSTVTVLNESELVSSAAYLLFYSKLPESEPPEIK